MKIGGAQSGKTLQLLKRRLGVMWRDAMTACRAVGEKPGGSDCILILTGESTVRAHARVVKRHVGQALLFGKTPGREYNLSVDNSLKVR